LLTVGLDHLIAYEPALEGGDFQAVAELDSRVDRLCDWGNVLACSKAHQMPDHGAGNQQAVSLGNVLCGGM
jgi:hypothetical protein